MKINSLKALLFFYLQDQKKKERKERKIGVAIISQTEGPGQSLRKGTDMLY